jgi:hypothetical protein
MFPPVYATKVKRLEVESVQGDSSDGIVNVPTNSVKRFSMKTKLFVFVATIEI